jgi:hypothetical protein
VGLGYALGGPIEGWYLVAHAFGTLLCLALGEIWIRTRFVTRELTGLSLLGLIAFAVVYPRVTHAPPYAALAAALRPRLIDAASGYPSFVARDCDVLQGYLDRAGARLEDLAADPARAASDPRLKAFVIGPVDAERQAGRAWLSWLSGHAQEIPASELANTGADSGYRVFVR